MTCTSTTCSTQVYNLMCRVNIINTCKYNVHLRTALYFLIAEKNKRNNNYNRSITTIVIGLIKIIVYCRGHFCIVVVTAQNFDPVD